MIANSRTPRWPLAVFLVLAFLFRLAFGLTNMYWSSDEIQIHLIGLKFYTTGAWPYFGPDVIYTQSQIPGALLGMLVGGPMYLLPIPEAPFILVNLLSVAVLALFAWYTEQHLPDLPRWFIWIWLFTAPWTLHFGSHVHNPDYVMIGAIIFFVGLWETVPGTRKGVIRRSLAGAMMGFGLVWIVQLHMSWPILGPLFAYAAWCTFREGRQAWQPWVLGVAGGAALIGLLLLPTVVTAGIGGTQRNAVWVPQNPFVLFTTILARFLSFASYELAYWLGGSTASRLAFVGRHLWVAPFAAFLFVLGYVQPIILAVAFFRRRTQAAWPAVRGLALATVITLFAAFNFSVEGPRSHTFYLAMPMAMFYSMFCWSPWLEQARWRRAAVAMLLSGLFVSASFMADYVFTKSLYVDRARVIRAMLQGEYRIVGERRSTEWGCCY